MSQEDIKSNNDKIASIAADTTEVTANQIPCPIQKWHGGSPLDTYGGSCYCGNDKYCMCTPSLAIDAIIEVHTNDDGDGKEEEIRHSESKHDQTTTRSKNKRNVEDSATVTTTATLSRKITSSDNKTIENISIHNDVELNTRFLKVDNNEGSVAELNANSKVSLILVFRGAPPAGYAIPGGEYRDVYRDEYRDGYGDEYRDEYHDVYGGVYGYVYRDGYGGEYRDEYRDEYCDEYRDEYGDEYRDEYRDVHCDG